MEWLPSNRSASLAGSLTVSFGVLREGGFVLLIYKRCKHSSLCKG
jgi:hypothetical protein